MTTLRLENVSKTYRNSKTGAVIQALDQASLHVRDAQVMGIIGPSGSGKSTLLRLVAGRELDYDGDIFYDNRNMKKVKFRERHLSLIFQEEARYPHFQGRSRLDVLLRRNLVPDEETEGRISLVAETMGLNSRELAKRKQGRHHNSQDHRLAIGQALVRDPELILFDEPFSNFDPQIRSKTRAEVKRLLRNFKLTALFVTHDQTEALAISNHIAVMNEGRIEQSGTFRQLYERPVNTFVAGFLGLPPMNLLSDLPVTDQGATVDQVHLPLPEAVRHALGGGRTITAGVRPEDIVLATDEAPADGVRVRGTITLVEPDFTRNVQLVHLNHDTRTYVVRTTLAQKIRTGDQLEVVLPPAQLHFFDSRSQERIG